MLGVDVVDVARFRSILERSPNFRARFFTPAELSYCDASVDEALHLAATFAAKEAVMKALRLTPAVAAARRIEIVRRASGAPSAKVADREVPISISHDGGVAVAIALAVDFPTPLATPASADHDAQPRPNQQLARFLLPRPASMR